MYRGYVKLWRRFEESRTWSRGANTVYVALALLLRANHRNGWFAGRVIRRGQLALSSEAFAAGLGMSRGTFRRALEHLEIDGFITTIPASKFTLVSICNYDAYQNEAGEDRPAGDTADGTADEPATGQQPATNKNDKNDKKCVSRVRAREGCRKPVNKSVPKGKALNGGAAGWAEPSAAEVDMYALMHGKFVDSVRFIAYWKSRGWARDNGARVTDWRPLVLTWREDRNPAAEGWQKSYEASKRGVERLIAERGGLEAGMATGIIAEVRGRFGAFVRPGDEAAHDAAYLGARAAVDAWKAAPREGAGK